MNLMVIINIITAIFYLYIGVSSYMYDSKNKLNRIFFVLCLNLALWAMMLTVMNAVSDAETAAFYRRSATIFWSPVYCLILHFSLVMVKKDRLLNKPWALFLFYSPSIICIYLYCFFVFVLPQDMVKIPYGWAYLNPSHDFFWDSFDILYCLIYTFASIVIIYQWGKQSELKREKKQSQIIAGSMLAVIALGSITDFILPTLGVPLLPPMTICFIVLPIYGIWYSINRYRFMSLSPQNAVFDLMKTMQEGMIITDNQWIIRDINQGATAILGFGENELRDKHIRMILPEDWNYQIVNSSYKNESFFRTKGDEKLPVLFSTSTLPDEWGEAYGSILTFRDLTEIKRIQKELQESHADLEVIVSERTRELNTANEELRNEIKTRIEMEQEIKKMAYYDPLTGLSNKRLFMDYLNKKIFENLRNEMSLSVLYLDLDSFKMINDTMGYARGDELLKKVAERLISALRASDTIARVGGDKFLVMVQNNPDENTISIIATKLNEAFRQKFDLAGNEVYTTVSIGIALFPVDGEDAETLIKNAEIAMYKAKEKGKNKYEICNPGMKTSLMEMMKLTNHLYRAVGRKEFELHYQPQVDILSGNIVGFEALIRWLHPERGVISPNTFIPIAEKTGLIIPIGEWVLETACRQMKAWQDQGLIRVPVAVNLSIRQFIDYDIVGVVSEILHKTGLEPKFLELEITESMLMEDAQSIRYSLEQFDRMGVRISIDDFGTEYSSLNYLKELPIHRIKIDMSFVQGITINHKDEAIIHAIITLSRNLEIEILAEGVETFQQMEFLKNADCSIIQGFYLYQPMEATRIEQIIGKE